MAINRRGFLAGTAAAGALWSIGGTVGCGSAPPEGGSLGKGLPDAAYFQQLSADLGAAGYGTPQIVIDLDRLDANADAIVREIGRDRYRIVEKSLPSLDLLDYVRRRAGTDRFMVLHLPFLGPLLAAFPSAQVLVGKVNPIAAVRRLFDELPSTDRANAASRVHFLVDSRARLDELVALATALGVQLQVGIEIDAGLRRGGVRRPSELPPVLGGFVANPRTVRFSGLLGYDGHVVAAPAAPGIEMAGVRGAYRAVEATFRASVDIIKSDFGSLWRSDLIFDSGGSSSYPLHKGGVVNDVAAGGGLLRPEHYPDTLIGELLPAVFIAAPVIARFENVELPFVGKVSQSLLDSKQAFTMYGGGWPAVFVYPRDLSMAPLVSDPEGTNLVPNQSLIMAPKETAIGPDDWIFHQPRLADALFQFQDILLVRGGRLQGERWRAYPRRY